MNITNNKREAPESNTHEELTRFLSIFWQRKTYVVLGVVLGLIVGSIYYARARPVFQSTARVLVIKKGEVLPVSGGDFRGPIYEDYIGTQQVLIRSPAVLGRVVKYKEFKELKSFSQNPQKAMDQISGSLSVLRGSDKEKEGGTTGMIMGGSNVLTFVYKGSNAEDCTRIIGLLLNAYSEYLKETFKDNSKETLALIKNLQGTQTQAIEAKQKEYQQFIDDNPLAVINRSKSKDGFASASVQYGLYEAQQAALFLRKLEIESHLQSLKRAEKAKASREVMQRMIERFERLAANSTGKTSAGESGLDSTLYQMLLKEADLLQKFGPEHQEVKNVRGSIAQLKKLISDRAEGINSGPGQSDLIKTHRETLAQELEDIKDRDKNLFALMEREKEAAGKTIGDQLKLAQMENDIHAAENIRTNILDQVQKLDMTKDVGGYHVEPLNPPSIAAQIEPRAALTFSLAIVAGLMLGFGLAYVSDMADRSFRNPDEIARSLKMAVVGHVPVLSGKLPPDQQDTKLSPFLCTHFRPKSREAEAFREVRTALYFNTRNTSCRKLQVTSAAAGDGKSTMASNLAVSIAQSGKKVLMIDCDLRRPRIHTIFGLSNDIGFSTVLTEKADPLDVIHQDVVPGLSIIPAGPSIPNPAEILTSPRFQECANLLAEKYDFVIFDTPPLLIVTDPAVIAPRMDGVFLVVKIGKRQRMMAERSAEVLRTLEANVIGVVVNSNGMDGMGYGRYGKYYYGRYSYYYGSGSYRYGKGYTYGGDGYYAEEEREDPKALQSNTPKGNGRKVPVGASMGNGQSADDETMESPGKIKRAFRWFLGD